MVFAAAALALAAFSSGAPVRYGAALMQSGNYEPPLFADRASFTRAHACRDRVDQLRVHLLTTCRERAMDAAVDDRLTMARRVCDEVASDAEAAQVIEEVTRDPRLKLEECLARAPPKLAELRLSKPPRQTRRRAA
jgi:hypothetical protein